MLESADSELRDANVATETLNFAKSNVLMNSSESLLAQANQAAGSVTGLLVS
jgi:flagellin-like hook-associated protein FlgL